MPQNVSNSAVVTNCKLKKIYTCKYEDVYIVCNTYISIVDELCNFNKSYSSISAN